MLYIDCGSHYGNTVKEALRSKKYSHIIAFDPNPFLPPLDIPGVIFHNTAVWDSFGTLLLYYNTNDTHNVGTTCIESKKGGWLKYNASVEVPCVDFSHILDLIEDDITVKMDIEGAEYRVLEHLSYTGTIKKIKALHVERHWDRIGLPEEVDKCLFKYIESQGVKVYAHS